MSGNQVARTACRTIIDPNKPPSQRNDRWLTPPDVVEALGHFDLDPCGAPGHVLADETYLLENEQDGLALPWHGRVFMNPPYGRVMRQWVERLVAHGTGTALIPVATGTKLWQEVVWREAAAVHFYRHRIKFIRRDLKDDAMVSPQASAIVAFGPDDADALLNSDLPGVAIDLRERTKMSDTTDAEVQAAASAMFDVADEQMHFPTGFDQAPEPLADTYRRMARAALVAVKKMNDTGEKLERVRNE